MIDIDPRTLLLALYKTGTRKATVLSRKSGLSPATVYRYMQEIASLIDPRSMPDRVAMVIHNGGSTIPY